MKRIIAGFIVAMSLLVELAVAGDGVIEINQVRAVAGAVTPGDTPGFPVTLSQSGSYRLTSNLDVRSFPSPSNISGIVIAANDVTIDLNGFWILGPAVCTQTCDPSAPFTCAVTTCTGGGTGVGIDGWPASPWSGSAVRNGGVRGMGRDGIKLGKSSTVENVTVTSNGGRGIASPFSLGIPGLVVRNASTTYNGGIGMEGPDVVDRSRATANGGTGISAHSVLHSYSTGNGASGIIAASAVGNHSSANVSYGLRSSSAYGQNIFASNNAGTALGQVTGGVQLGPNICNGAPCP